MDLLASRNSQSWLSWFFRGLLILLFLVLFSKLFEIQIIKGSYYRALSRENRIRHIPIPAARGKIYSRDGEILVGNKEVSKKITFNSTNGYELTTDLTNAQPEEIVKDYVRVYPLAENFAHASGYIGLVDEKQVGKINPECPEKGPRTPQMLVGKNGLELEYECLLSGMSGEELLEVDTKGARVRSLGRREPVNGKDLKLTIDSNLQQQVARSMEGKKGAAIVTDTKGAILAFYSGPSFDPNLLIATADKQSKKDEGFNEKVSALFSNPDLPFFNRVIGGTFHPGSVYKPLVAIAALEEGAIDKDYTYDDQGIINVGTFSYTNWYFTEFGKKEGLVDLPRALARSTDTFFYKIGELVGPDAIAKWSEKFGLGKTTGIDLPGEVAGLIPTPDWKKKVKKENWFLGNTYHMSIGQGDVSLAPIDINTYIAGVSQDGIVCKPHFKFDKQEDCRDVGVSSANLDLVKEGMKQACSQGGTAYTFFDFAATHGDTVVGCKTGTAEVGVVGEPHAWFTAFGPLKDPQIVATVLVEKGGQGSQVAGPVVRQIFDYYFASLKTKNPIN